MEIVRVDYTTPTEARGITIVIDVIRAFSVAGYAFAGGAKALWLVCTAEEAVVLRNREPEALLGGEIGGRLIPGFDFNNSPSQMATRDVRGKLLIQRTGAGTQGAVNATQASIVLLCALTNAQATANYARTLAQATNQCITLYPTAYFEDAAHWSEDDICADYVEALLGERNDAQDILNKGIAHLEATGRFEPWLQESSDFPAGDITAVLAVNCFNFAMVGTRKEWQDIIYVDTHRVNSDI